MNEREKIIRLWFDMWIKKADLNCLTGKRSLSLSSQHPTVLREMDEVQCKQQSELTEFFE